jgi:hypothetical protein
LVEAIDIFPGTGNSWYSSAARRSSMRFSSLFIVSFVVIEVSGTSLFIIEKNLIATNSNPATVKQAYA